MTRSSSPASWQASPPSHEDLLLVSMEEDLHFNRTVVRARSRHLGWDFYVSFSPAAPPPPLMICSRILESYFLGLARACAALPVSQRTQSDIFHQAAGHLQAAAIRELQVAGHAFGPRSRLAPAREEDHTHRILRGERARQHMDDLEAMLAMQSERMGYGLEGLSRQYLGDDLAAEARAKETLIHYLNESQRRELERTDSFTVRAQDGNYYKVIKKFMFNVVRGNYKYCAQPAGNLPVYDCMLASKLWLENCFEEFMRVANRIDTSGIQTATAERTQRENFFSFWHNRLR